MKKFVSILCILILFVVQIGFLADVASMKAEAAIDFSCGENLTWYINTETKTMTVSGMGDMSGYNSINSPAPWSDYKQYIETLVVENGVTSIGSSAFYGCDALKNIVLSSSVKEIEDFAFASCKNLMTLSLPEGVESMGKNVFNGCNSLKKIELPSTLISLSDTSFSVTNSLEEILFPNGSNLRYTGSKGLGNQCKWYNDLPDGPVYMGSVLYGYKGEMPENTTLVIKDGTQAVNFRAFMNMPNLVDVIFPESLWIVHMDAFAGTTWLENQPDGLVYAGNVLYTYKGVMGLDEKISLPEGTLGIADYAFMDCDLLTELILPSTLRYIGHNAFSGTSLLKSMIVPKNVEYIYGTPFVSDGTFTIYCYANSAVHNHAEENSIPYILLEDIPEVITTESLASTIEQTQSINRSLYSDESLAALDAAVSVVDLEAENLTQTQVDEWEAAIKSAIANLKYKPADYYAVETAQKRAENIDRSLYTAESLATLDSALASVEENLDITNQDKVNSTARAINEAIDNLEYLPADYTKVEAAISESSKYDRRLYSQVTLAVLDQSISAVEYGLNIMEQAKVNGFAEQISNAISALEYAAVVLRNEPHGVIVSATAKEIDPDTALTVDLKDSSDLQSGNFAVGGTVKSITLYDINLLLNAQKTQPDGFVTVKIKLPDGVDPKRCKVYHVIDDPVDPLVRYTTSLEGNFIVFETDHFSEFAVIEVETVLDSIEITKRPNKTIYALGETVNTSGLEVTAHYSDGSAKPVSDYDVSSVDTSSIGTKAITVYHTYNGITKSASFEIAVSGDRVTANITLNGEDINEYNKKVAWYKGYSSESVKLDCDVSGGYKVEWSSDNSKVLVDSNGNVTNKGFFFARKATITVKVTDSAGNVLATDSITVRFYKFSFQLSNIQSTMVQVFRKSGLIY